MRLGARIERETMWREVCATRRVPMCFPSWVKHPELLDKVPNLGTAKPANYVTYVGAPAIEKARVRTHDAHGACDRGA